MTKAKGDQLPLGFHDHYLIQGLRDQVEELQGALQRATEELNEIKAPLDSLSDPDTWQWQRMTIDEHIEAICIDLRVSDTRLKEMTRILDQLQQKEVKLS